MRNVSRTQLRIAFAAGISFAACAGPMVEGNRHATAQPPASETTEAPPVTREGGTTAQPDSSARAVDPLQLDSRMRDIVSSLSGDANAIVSSFFSRFHRGGSEGVTVMDMTGRPPRTAPEARDQGGDCTDLAMFATSVLREKGVPGGVIVVHFDSAPAGTDHMVPYVDLGGRRVIVDLQAATLGATAQGRYSTLLTMTFDQAASMYYREQGDYLRQQGRSTEAIAAYNRAVEIFEGDAYVHQHLGFLYQAAGNTAESERHFSRAGELDPHYRRLSQTVDRNEALRRYNAALDAAEAAFRAGRFDECVRQFQAALDSGVDIPAEDRRVIERNLARCRAH